MDFTNSGVNSINNHLIQFHYEKFSYWQFATEQKKFKLG